VLDLGWHLGFLAVAFASGRMAAAAQRGEKMPLVARNATWETIWALIPFLMLAGAIVGWQRVDPSDGFERGVLLALSALLLLRCTMVAVHNLRLARLTNVDQLTGAFNHRHFQEQVVELAAEAVDRRRPLSIVLVDVDDFEALNDAGGHVEGDRVLREVAWTLRQHLEPGDLLFRLGADEFAMALRDRDPEAAVAVARAASEHCASDVHGVDELPLSLTIAVASLPDHTFDAHELAHLASGTLYWAKLNDKRNITCYDPNVVKVLSAEERVQLIEQRAQLRAVLALARALDARDAYTARHSQNVARNAIAIAFELGWSSEKTELLRIAGLLHDVGKIGVRDSTLRKSERLTDDEWQELRQHPVLSARVIEGVAPDEIIPWVLGHHERIDGRGYPSNLEGDDVPMGARILAVADTFDAMTTSRSYRPALAVETAVGEIIACAGSQFDPIVVRAFLNALLRGSIRTSAGEEAMGDGWSGTAPSPMQPAPMAGIGLPYRMPAVALDPEFLPGDEVDGADELDAAA
jgi:diguanylate cyclase (GGDEF)-like protein